MTDPILKLEKVTRKYEGITAVASVTLALRPGEVVGLIGPNGAGKTTLFNLVSGFVSVSSGHILWKGTDITGMSKTRRVRLGLGRTFQHVKTFPALTVAENFTLASAAARLNGRAARRVDELVEFLGLEKWLEQPAAELSYGSSRKLSLGLALLLKPELLMLDEPTAGLTESDFADVIEIVHRLNSEGTTLWIVEHNMAFVSVCCERVIVLDAGRIIADDVPQSLVLNPLVVEAYLGGGIK